MKVVVYGSLRREQGNRHWMTQAQWLGDCKLTGYELYDLGYYPAAVKGDGELLCEIYRINAQILAELDELKNEGRDYSRELIKTPLGNAWIYLYQLSVDNLNKIDSGDWLARILKNTPTDEL